MESFEIELLKITEAYCIEHNLPIKRRFTHEELEEAMQRVRQAIADQQPLEMPDFSPHVHVGDAPGEYWREKAKERREEFKAEDEYNRQRVWGIDG